MTERGLPPDGAPACPFVAFEDDRDARATVPDHRHRCFAEPRPAPRALAHQEAYCLSSAFPVCPTFQDWARREAAAARPTPGSARAGRDDALVANPVTPPLDREADAPDPDQGLTPVQRSGAPRDWAAPPPWTGDPAGGGSGPGAAAAGLAGAGLAGAAGAAGDEDAFDVPRDVPAVPPRPTSGSSSPSSTGSEDWDAGSRGLAGSAAYRLAGPDPDEPQPAAPPRGDEPQGRGTGPGAGPGARGPPGTPGPPPAPPP